MSKKSTKDVLTSPFLITVYAIILMIVFLFFKFKTNEGIIVNSFEAWIYNLSATKKELISFSWYNIHANKN